MLLAPWAGSEVAHAGGGAAESEWGSVCSTAASTSLSPSLFAPSTPGGGLEGIQLLSLHCNWRQQEQQALHADRPQLQGLQQECLQLQGAEAQPQGQGEGRPQPEEQQSWEGQEQPQPQHEAQQQQQQRQGQQQQGEEGQLAEGEEGQQLQEWHLRRLQLEQCAAFQVLLLEHTQLEAECEDLKAQVLALSEDLTRAQQVRQVALVPSAAMSISPVQPACVQACVRAKQASCSTSRSLKATQHQLK